MFDLDQVESRILGCLLEKQRTTPDTYPLTLNALRLACNQATNRDPVMDLDEHEVQEALQRLHRRELTRVASGHGSRASKYRHLLAEKLALPDDQSALLAVLLLRGEQTPGELKQRSERIQAFEDLEAVIAALAEMAERELVLQLERRPGEKQVRYRQLMSADAADSGEPAGQQPADSGAVIRRSPTIAGLAAQTGNGTVVEIEQLREALEKLSGEVAELRARLDRRESAEGERE
jgi:uncharacterized protein YceH (UPF0502 family)